MVGKLYGELDVTLNYIYSLDNQKTEVLGSMPSSKVVTDSNYGGVGSVDTVVPTTQNLVLQNLESSTIEEMANDRINGVESKSIVLDKIIKLDATNIKGVIYA